MCWWGSTPPAASAWRSASLGTWFTPVTPGCCSSPPHLAEKVAESGLKTRVRDIFGFQRIREGKYLGSDIDTFPWSVEMMEDLVQWIAAEEAVAPYRSLDWPQEMEEARQGKRLDEHTWFNRHWTNTQMRKLDEV